MGVQVADIRRRRCPFSVSNAAKPWVAVGSGECRSPRERRSGRTGRCRCARAPRCPSRFPTAAWASAIDGGTNVRPGPAGRRARGCPPRSRGRAPPATARPPRAAARPASRSAISRSTRARSASTTPPCSLTASTRGSSESKNTRLRRSIVSISSMSAGKALTKRRGTSSIRPWRTASQEKSSPSKHLDQLVGGVRPRRRGRVDLSSGAIGMARASGGGEQARRSPAARPSKRDHHRRAQHRRHARRQSGGGRGGDRRVGGRVVLLPDRVRLSGSGKIGTKAIRIARDDFPVAGGVRHLEAEPGQQQAGRRAGHGRRRRRPVFRVALRIGTAVGRGRRRSWRCRCRGRSARRCGRRRPAASAGAAAPARVASGSAAGAWRPTTSSHPTGVARNSIAAVRPGCERRRIDGRKQGGGVLLHCRSIVFCGARRHGPDGRPAGPFRRAPTARSKRDSSRGGGARTGRSVSRGAPAVT